MKITAFVPFRKGSKSIPDKNIKKLNESPLFKIVIDEILKVSADLLEKVIIATDYDKNFILSNLKEDERIIFWDRNGYDNANDKSSTESVILDYLKETREVSDYLMLIQITNPFLTEEHITKAIKEYTGNGTLFSVVDFKRFIWEENYILGQEDYERPRRQDMKNRYLENGSFYIFPVSRFLINKNRMIKPISFYEMPQESLWEIDEEKDWKIIEKILKK